jgi:hypothetical protein
MVAVLHWQVQSTKVLKIMSNVKFAADHVIHVLATACPKRAGSKSAATWAVYKQGQTVSQYIEAHAKAKAHYTPAACLTWDTKHGFVAVLPVGKLPAKAASSK